MEPFGTAIGDDDVFSFKIHTEILVVLDKGINKNRFSSGFRVLQNFAVKFCQGFKKLWWSFYIRLTDIQAQYFQSLVSGILSIGRQFSDGRKFHVINSAG